MESDIVKILITILALVFEKLKPVFQMLIVNGIFFYVCSKILSRIKNCFIKTALSFLLGIYVSINVIVVFVANIILLLAMYYTFLYATFSNFLQLFSKEIILFWVCGMASCLYGVYKLEMQSSL